MAEWPTTPDPPVRLTTFTGWPRSFSIRLAMKRATASVPPPAPQGTTSVSGRFGYWAKALALRHSAARASTARKGFIKRIIVSPEMS